MITCKEYFQVIGNVITDFCRGKHRKILPCIFWWLNRYHEMPKHLSNWMLEGEESNNGIENVFCEILAGNFRNLEKHSNIQTQEMQRSPNRIILRRSSPQPIIARLVKITEKDKILNMGKEKHQVTYKDDPIRLTTDLLSEAIKARKESEDIFKMLKKKKKKFNQECYTQQDFPSHEKNK